MGEPLLCDNLRAPQAGHRLRYLVGLGMTIERPLICEHQRKRGLFPFSHFASRVHVAAKIGRSETQWNKAVTGVFCGAFSLDKVFAGEGDILFEEELL